MAPSPQPFTFVARTKLARVVLASLAALSTSMGAHADAPATLDVVTATANTVVQGEPLEVTLERFDGLLRAGDLAGAERAVDEAAHLAPTAADALRWMAAAHAHGAGTPPTRALSARLLDEVGNAGGALFGWALVVRAERTEWTDVVGARRAAERAVAVGASPFLTRARAVLARIQLRGDERRTGIARLEELLSAVPDDVAAPELTLPLADALAASDDEGDRLRAVALYRRFAYRAPASRQADAKLARARELLATLTPERRAEASQPSLADQLARARAFARLMRHEDAAREYGVVAERAPDSASRCLALLERGKALFSARQRRDAATALVRATEQCPAGELRVAARFWAGRTFSALDAQADAIRHYDALADEAPAHRLADDALVRAALAAHASGDDDAMSMRLAAVAARAAGDMRDDARFALFWRARADRRLPEALRELEAAKTGGVVESEEGARGRVDYWYARTLEQLNRHPDAEEAYESLVAFAPLTYYGALAYARLKALDPSRAAELRELLRQRRADADARAAASEHGGLPGASTFERLGLLARLGEDALIDSELAFLGLAGDGGDPRTRWRAARTLAAAGQPKLAVRLARGFSPESGDAALGRDALLVPYPLAFAPLLDDAAAESNVSVALLRAIAREETSFDPTAVSPARAYGLVQLTEATAARFGRELAIDASRRALLTAEPSARIGARYLAYLTRRFGDVAPLVAASYNAGEGAVERWLGSGLRDRELDVFVESIPYEETRNYTRRVTQTAVVYAWLKDRDLPTLPLVLPAR